MKIIEGTRLTLHISPPEGYSIRTLHGVPNPLSTVAKSRFGGGIKVDFDINVLLVQPYAIVERISAATGYICLLLEACGN
jgi:hypothetical protein